MNDESQKSKDASNQLDGVWAQQEIERLRKENAEMKAARRQGFAYNQMSPGSYGADLAARGGQIVVTDDGRTMYFEDASAALRAERIAEAVATGMERVMKAAGGPVAYKSNSEAKVEAARAYANALRDFAEIESEEQSNG